MIDEGKLEGDSGHQESEDQCVVVNEADRESVAMSSSGELLKCDGCTCARDYLMQAINCLMNDECCEESENALSACRRAVQWIDKRVD